MNDNSALEIFDGEFEVTIGLDPITPSESRLFELAGNARLSISGGTYVSTNDPDLHVDLIASDQSHVTLIGSEFDLPMFEPIAARSGVINGVLLDGSDVSLTYRRGPDATIMLVPEPGGFVLLMTGVTSLLVCRIRHPRRNVQTQLN